MPALPALMAWAVAAVLVGENSTLAVWVAVTCSVVAAVCTGRWRVLAVPLVCVGVIAAGCAWRLTMLENAPIRELAQQRSVVVADAVVASDPKRFSRFGTDSALVQLSGRRVTAEGTTVSGRFPVLAILREPARGVSVGERMIATGRLRPSSESDIVAVLDVRRHVSADGRWWWTAANRVREGVRHGVRNASPDARALVPALVDGDDSGLSDQVSDEFRRAGLTHLLAVSGTNLTIVLMLALAVARAAGVGRRQLIVVGLLAVAGFVLLARPEPSVVRAAAMGTVCLVAIAVGGHGGLRALTAAVLALLFVDPWLARSPGFILSVCATAGILVLASPLAARLGRWMPHWCALAVSVPLAAQWACLPALVALSGEISVVAVAANIVAAPLVAPATIAGLLAGLIDLLHGGLALVPGALAGWCADGIIAVAHGAAGLSGAAVPWRGPWWLVLLVVPGVAFAVWRVANRPTVVVGLVLGLSVGMARPPQVGWPPAGWLMVSCDVGQGDAAVVNAGPSSAILVDAGPDPLAADGCLRRLGVRRLPLAVITHAHADHLAGWPGAVRGREIGTVLHGPSGGPGRPVVAGERFRVGAVGIDVLWPPAGSRRPDEDDGTSMNNFSVVLRIRSRGVRMLLTGDVEPRAQAAIAASGVPLQSHVLKVPHHGSGAQFPDFLRAVGAQVATISVGADNDYGHPAPSALRMLREVRTDWHRTDLEGDIAVVRRGGRLSVVTRSLSP